MSDERKSLFESAANLFGTLRDYVQVAGSTSVAPEEAEAESGQSIDPDFQGWLHNDPMVTMNPASRYGDDATGFLAGAELENPELGRTDD